MIGVVSFDGCRASLAQRHHRFDMRIERFDAFDKGRDQLGRGNLPRTEHRKKLGSRREKKFIGECHWATPRGNAPPLCYHSTLEEMPIRLRVRGSLTERRANAIAI